MGRWASRSGERAVSQLFVYPARVRSSGRVHAGRVIHVTDVRAAVEEMRGRGVAFEEYDTPHTLDPERHCPDARRRRSGVVQGLGRQPGRRCSSLRRISRISEPPRRVVYPRRLVQTVCYWLTHSELVDLRGVHQAESTPSRAKSGANCNQLITGCSLHSVIVSRRPIAAAHARRTSADGAVLAEPTARAHKITLGGSRKRRDTTVSRRLPQSRPEAVFIARVCVTRPFLARRAWASSSSADMAGECLMACLSLDCGEFPLRLLVERAARRRRGSPPGAPARR